MSKFVVALSLCSLAACAFGQEGWSATNVEGMTHNGKLVYMSAQDVKGTAKLEKKACCPGEKMVAEHKEAKLVNGKKACCKSTEAKPMAKGDAGCCNAKGEMAKFKVFVANEGYKFFGCEGSAGEGRAELLKKYTVVGPVQKVTSKVAM